MMTMRCNNNNNLSDDLAALRQRLANNYPIRQGTDSFHITPDSLPQSSTSTTTTSNTTTTSIQSARKSSRHEPSQGTRARQRQTRSNRRIQDEAIQRYDNEEYSYYCYYYTTTTPTTATTILLLLLLLLLPSRLSVACYIPATGRVSDPYLL
eukprot:GHVQ01020990.1.p1 GENE.GHVQ01020990.1~~GHVQ01020990.1.p1  ORF type:complete len:152 (-),score=27.80 GHVQ01020990.1:1206-1661(-)